MIRLGLEPETSFEQVETRARGKKLGLEQEASFDQVGIRARDKL